MPRPKGRKNNATLIREAETDKALKLCQGTALSHAPDIVLAMAEKAKQGDVAAAKVILDRVYPAMRQVEDRQNGTVAIQINITGADDGNHSWQGETIEQPFLNADGESPDDTEGGEELAEHAGEEGKRTH